MEAFFIVRAEQTRQSVSWKMSLRRDMGLGGTKYAVSGDLDSKTGCWGPLKNS